MSCAFSMICYDMICYAVPRVAQLRMHGNLIIATIWAFLHSRGLLTHFPAMVRGGFLHAPPVTLPPALRECPSWRDPEGGEAQEVGGRG